MATAGSFVAGFTVLCVVCFGAYRALRGDGGSSSSSDNETWYLGGLLSRPSDASFSHNSNVRGPMGIVLPPHPERIPRYTPTDAADGAGAVDSYFGGVDYRRLGVVTPVKDQGDCDSCWAFATVATIESQWALRGHRLRNLSEQELVGCYKRSCTGSWPTLAAEWLLEEQGGWITGASDYPYNISAATECALPKPNRARIRSVKDLGPLRSVFMLDPSEESLRFWVANQGTAAVVIDATALYNPFPSPYFLNDCSSSPTAHLHAVTVVGFNTSSTANAPSGYWILKNSWAATWGDNGYFYIQMGSNKCGISNWATVVRIHQSGPQPLTPLWTIAPGGRRRQTEVVQASDKHVVVLCRSCFSSSANYTFLVNIKTGNASHFNGWAPGRLLAGSPSGYAMGQRQPGAGCTLAHESWITPFPATTLDYRCGVCGPAGCVVRNTCQNVCPASRGVSTRPLSFSAFAFGEANATAAQQTVICPAILCSRTMESTSAIQMVGGTDQLTAFFVICSTAATSCPNLTFFLFQNGGWTALGPLPWPPTALLFAHLQDIIAVVSRGSITKYNSTYQKVWQRNGLSIVIGAALASECLVVVGPFAITGYDPVGGAKMWSVDDPGSWSPPVASAWHKRVVFANQEQVGVFGVDVLTGKYVWSAAGKFIGKPVVTSDRLIIAAENGNVVALPLTFTPPPAPPSKVIIVNHYTFGLQCAADALSGTSNMTTGCRSVATASVSYACDSSAVYVQQFSKPGCVSPTGSAQKYPFGTCVDGDREYVSCTLP